MNDTEESREITPLSDAALDAAITEAVGRTRLLYRGELPTGYKVSHHPTAATNRKWKGTYPGGRVWAANAHDVYRHLWMTLIGTQP